MRLTITHPAMATSIGETSNETRTAVGTVQTDVEIREFSNGDVSAAFDRPAKGAHDQLPAKICRIDGVLWKASNKAPTDSLEQWRTSEGQLYFPIDEMEKSIKKLVAERKSGQIRPVIARKHSDGRDANGIFDFIDKCPPLAKRRLAVSDEEVEAWREKTRRYFDNFAMVGNILVERCHEPTLIVAQGTVNRRSFAIYSPYVNRPFWTPDAPLGFASDALYPWLHVFPADDHDGAIALSEEVLGGEAKVPWFELDCLGPCTPTEAVLEMETCRFAFIHENFFKQVVWKFNRRYGETELTSNLCDPSTDLGRYNAAVEDCLAATRRHIAGEGSFEEVLPAFDALVDTATAADKLFTTGGDEKTWTSLSDNTNRLMGRLDALPVGFEMTSRQIPAIR